MAQPQVTYHSSQAIVEHTEPSQTPLLQGLDDIQLTEPQKKTAIQIFSPDQHLPFSSQSESGETLVPNTIQQETPPALPLYTAQHQTQYQSAQQSEHVERMEFSQGLIAQHAQMTEFCNSFVQDSNETTIKELEQCIQQLQNEKDLLNKNEVVIKDEMDQLAKTNDTLKIQLLEAEKQRDELKDKVQLLEIEKQTIQKDLLNKIAILEAENQKQRDELKLLESEKHTINNDLENKIAVLDAENQKLSKLSMQPQSTTTAQEILLGVESDPTVLLTPRTEENIHSITQTYTDQKIEQVVHHITQQFAHPKGKDECEKEKANTKVLRVKGREDRKSKKENDYYYGSITRAGSKKQPDVHPQPDQLQTEIRKPKMPIPPLQRKALHVFNLLPDETKKKMRRFWKIEETS